MSSCADRSRPEGPHRTPADLVDRLYFVGYTVFTLGIGVCVRGEGTWQLATVAATGTGLIIVTLSITHLVPLASAVGGRRELAAYISSLGPSPSAILRTGWDGTGFDGLDEHFVELTTRLTALRQQHLTIYRPLQAALDAFLDTLGQSRLPASEPMDPLPLAELRGPRRRKIRPQRS